METGRGNGVVLLLHPIAFYLLLNRFGYFQILGQVLVGLVFILFLGGIQLVRYTDGLEKLKLYAESSGFNDATNIELLIIPTVMYVATPLINADLNLKSSELIKLDPYYSLQGIVPTVVRDYFFERGDYGELVSEANNASSYYIPFVRDFGVIGAFVMVSVISLIVAYCYARASQGSIYFILSYPPIFMSTVLSFFSLFFTSLVVLLYPMVVIWSLHGCLIKRSKKIS
jgi:hypothetical protein